MSFIESDMFAKRDLSEETITWTPMKCLGKANEIAQAVFWLFSPASKLCGQLADLGRCQLKYPIIPCFTPCAQDHGRKYWSCSPRNKYFYVGAIFTWFILHHLRCFLKKPSSSRKVL